VACENYLYGFFFDIPTARVDLSLRMPDGSVRRRDVQTISFFRFEDNEAHTHPLYGFKFGTEMKLTAHAEDVAGNVEKRPHALVANGAR
jgi:hypothetical protein